MACIDWEIVGTLTPEGKLRVSGFSMGGDELFDEPLDLDDMITALSESHEVPRTHLLSSAGKAQMRKLAATLSAAWMQIRDRLDDDKELRLRVEQAAMPDSAGPTLSIATPG